MVLKIKPLPPFDFSLSCQIFSDGDPHVRRYENGAFWQAVRLKERLALLRVHSLGTVEEPELILEISPEEKKSNKDWKAVESLVIRLFNLDLDLLPFYEAVRGDGTMAKLTSRLSGLKSPSTATVFEALIDSIIEQQISLRAAWSMQRRLMETFGDVLTLNDQTYLVFPDPKSLATATIEQLRGCGLSGRKAEYVRDVSLLVEQGLDLEGLRSYDEQSIIEEMSKIRGVGTWTAEMTMIRGMQKFDAIPADDLGLRRVISHYYYKDRRITGQEARSTAEAWKGWRGLASYYLIIAEILKIKVQDNNLLL